MKLKNLTPYLINAWINWLDDSGAIPQLLLKNSKETKFPPMFSKETVRFNVGDSSVRNMIIDDDGISFSARFSGTEHNVYAPLNCIVSLHSKDNTVNIPFTHGEQIQVPDVNSLEPVIPEFKVRLSVIEGGAKGNGIPSGKLSLVYSECLW